MRHGRGVAARRARPFDPVRGTESIGIWYGFTRVPSQIPWYMESHGMESLNTNFSLFQSELMESDNKSSSAVSSSTIKESNVNDVSSPSCATARNGMYIKTNKNNLFISTFHLRRGLHEINNQAQIDHTPTKLKREHTMCISEAPIRHREDIMFSAITLPRALRKGHFLAYLRQFYFF